MIRKNSRLPLLAAMALAAATTAAYPNSSSAAATMPPPGFDKQRWRHPNGCTYSRVGRPGEIAWIMIVNSIGPGKSCARKIAQVPYSGDRRPAVQSTKN